MRLRYASLAVVLILGSTAVAADRQISERFSASKIQADITYLASDELMGRDTGEPGNEMAARFVAAEFARDHLKPLGTNRQTDLDAPMDGSGYFQPFKVIAGRALGSDNRLTVNCGGNTHSYTPGPDVDTSGISAAGAASGPLVFAGYGIKAPRANHDDFTGLDVKGKIVMILAGYPGDDPHNPLADYSDIRRKASTIRGMGALAIIDVVTKDQFKAGVKRQLQETSDAGIPVLRARSTIGEQWIREATGKDLPTIWSEADAGKMVSMPLGATADLNADVHVIEKVSANIVGLVEGSDPTSKNEYVVIGAHVDHLGLGGPNSLAKSDTPAIHHGADDNASGSAGVMELAHWLGSPGAPKPKRSIVLMCFSGEEMGLLGSDHYVKHPIEPLDRTVAMLNMDMVGRLRDNKLIVIGSGTAKEWNHLLDETNKKEGFALARSESGFGASDQQSFYTKNIPVLFFFTGTHPDYHTPTDTADKINAPGEAHVLDLVADCAIKIADDPHRPTFQRMKVSDKNAPSRGFHVYLGSVPDYAAQVVGVQLNGVREGSPAEKGGLKAGDIIVKFGERGIKNVYDYTYALQDHRPGDVVMVIVKRNGQPVTLTITLAARPE